MSTQIMKASAGSLAKDSTTSTEKDSTGSATESQFKF